MHLSEKILIEQKGLVSVVVPIYNVELFLDKCIASIISQSYKDLEILLIDDGSPDRCGDICDRWEKKDSRIKIFHQKNQGVGIARNVGLDNSFGEYITCIDPDDYWDEKYVESMVKAIEDSDADIAFCGLWKESVNGKNLGYVNLKKEILVGNKMKSKIFGNFGYIIGGVCKLFKSKILKDNHIKYPTILRNGEDHIFLIDYLKNAKRSVNCGKILYHCVCRDNSASSNINKNEFSINQLRLWQYLNVHFCDEILFTPWMQYKLLIANAVYIDCLRHNCVNIDDFQICQTYVKRYRFEFFIYGDNPSMIKFFNLIKLYFPKIYLILKG